MKKKLYTKQRKMSEPPTEPSGDVSVSSQKESDDATESKEMLPALATLVKQELPPSATRDANEITLDNKQPITDETSAAVTVANINTTVVSTAASLPSSAPVMSPLERRNICNTTPLPKVDVLMKGSLRAFQLAENSNSEYNNTNTIYNNSNSSNNSSNDNSSANNTNNNNSSNVYAARPSPFPSPRLPESVGAEAQQVHPQNEVVWKEAEVASSNPEHFSSIAADSNMRQHYAISSYSSQTPSSGGYALRDINVMNRPPSRDASPVYHHMERPVQPLSDATMYSTAHPSAHLNTLNYTGDLHHSHQAHNGVHHPAPPSDPGAHNESVADAIRTSSYDMAAGPYSDGGGSDLPDGGDHRNLHGYGGHVRSWEQENSRYVDYAWPEGGGEHVTMAQHAPTSSVSGYSDEDSFDDDDDDQDMVDNDNDNPDDLNQNQKIKRNSGGRHAGGGKSKGSGGGSSSRRRRKRVQTPVQRSAANMRERRRMCHLNVAFDHLKEYLPLVKDKKKLSRIQTLKAAIYYIHLLQDSLNTAPKVSEV